MPRGSSWLAMVVAGVLALVIAGTMVPVQAAASYEASAPQNIRVTAGNGQATISWDPPAYTGGYDIIKYWVTSDNYADSCETPWRSTATSCTVYGLKNGTTYTFNVRAYNNIAYGVAGVSPSVTPCCSPPSAPTAVNGLSGDGSITVTWQTPSSTGGTIGEYVATASPGGARCSTSANSCVITGLANGTAYTISVTAANSAGISPASSPSAAVIPVGPPSPPQGVSARAVARGAVEVQWSAPASDGGAPVASYAAVAEPGGLSCVAVADACQISGLADGTDYVITIHAANRAGAGTPSAPVAVMTYGLPGVPEQVTAELGKGRAAVSWVAPATVGGAPITAFTVVSDPGGLTCTSTGRPSCIVQGLSNGSAYTFSVTAYTDAGAGPASAASAPARLVAGPGAPRSVRASTKGTTAIVKWNAPKSKGGLKISKYVVTASPSGKSCRTTKGVCTIKGLRLGTQYTFAVRAYNAKGAGAVAFSRAVSTPAPPASVTSNQPEKPNQPLS